MIPGGPLTLEGLRLYLKGDGDAVVFLRIQEVVDGVRGIDVKTADGIGCQQDGGGGGDLSAYQHLLYVSS